MSTYLRVAESDILTWLSATGRVFYASDADQNDAITGQTSFANTTPSLILTVPSGTTAIPLLVRLAQTGTVAGGAIDVIIEFDNIAGYASGGTAETVLGARTTGGPTNLCSVYSGATATAGYGVRVFARTFAQDVTPASTEFIPEVVWAPIAGLDHLVGPACMKVFTYAGTTGPTWFWTVKWAEFPTAWL